MMGPDIISDDAGMYVFSEEGRVEEPKMAVRVTAHFRSVSHPTQVWEFPASYTRPRIERIVLGFADNHGLQLVELNGIQYEEL